MSDKPTLIITEGMIQNLAESNLGRKLTKKELDEVALSMIDDDKVVNERDSFILDAIHSSVNNSN